VAAALALAAVPAAAAEIVVRTDGAGREIRFDVRVEGAPVDRFAERLSTAAHGDEIRTVLIAVVGPEELVARCGGIFAACYSRGTVDGSRITLPATASLRTVLHEYGHHLDATHAVPGVPEHNGTPGWWAARGRALAEAGETERDYTRGWDRSLGEVFAEDYAAAHGASPFMIPWLASPTEAVRSALLTEVSAGTLPAPAPPAPRVVPPAPPPPDVVAAHGGALAPRQEATFVFSLARLTGRVGLEASIIGGRSTRAQGHVAVRCSSGRVSRAPFAYRRSTTLDLTSQLGRECTATVSNSSRVRLRYALRVTATPRS
jgi:hypothetical protein